MDRLDKEYGLKRGDTSNLDSPSLLSRKPLIKGITYKVKDYPKNERANLPPEVRILLFFQIKGHKTSKRLIWETREKYPQYFEPVVESKIIT